METTEDFPSQTIKEEPSSPASIDKNANDDDELLFQVNNREAGEEKEVTTQSENDILLFSRGIKLEELDIPATSSDEETNPNEWLEPVPCAIKEESGFVQRLKVEESNNSGMLVVPQTYSHGDLKSFLFQETSETTGIFIKVPLKNHPTDTMQLSKLYSKSFVLLGKRIDHLQSNIKTNNHGQSIECPKSYIYDEKLLRQQQEIRMSDDYRVEKNNKNPTTKELHSSEIFLELSTDNFKVTNKNQILSSDKAITSQNNTEEIDMIISRKINTQVQSNKLLKPMTDFFCNLCMKTLSSKSSLRQHLKTHTDVKPFSCKHCKKSFFQKNHLKLHLNTHTGEKPYSCIYCTKPFSHKSDLGRHERTHTGEKPYYCKHCMTRFSRKYNLVVHLRTHTGEKPYYCTHCMKSYSLKRGLISHLNAHTGEKPYFCIHCKKSFSHKFYLESHLRTHTGEKPFPCKICMKSFSSNNSLRLHLKTHTGEKPYSCEYCKKSFSQKCHLKLHIRTHTDEKPYFCIHCKKSFSQKCHLKSHLMTHTGEKPYSCGICMKSFSRNYSLRLHLKTHSGKKLTHANIA